MFELQYLNFTLGKTRESFQKNNTDYHAGRSNRMRISMSRDGC